MVALRTIRRDRGRFFELWYTVVVECSRLDAVTARRQVAGAIHPLDPGVILGHPAQFGIEPFALIKAHLHSRYATVYRPCHAANGDGAI